jgi:ribosome maturation protein Sdo1
VSKGQMAKKEDLIDAFGIDDQNKICLEVHSSLSHLKNSKLFIF